MPCRKFDTNINNPVYESTALFITTYLTQLCDDALQVAETNLPDTILIKQSEYLSDFLLGITLRHLRSQEFKEIVEVDGISIFLVDLTQQTANVGLAHDKSKRSHTSFQLLCINKAYREENQSKGT